MSGGRVGRIHARARAGLAGAAWRAERPWRAAPRARAALVSRRALTEARLGGGGGRGAFGDVPQGRGTFRPIHLARSGRLPLAPRGGAARRARSAPPQEAREPVRAGAARARNRRGRARSSGREPLGGPRFGAGPAARFGALGPN